MINLILSQFKNCSSKDIATKMKRQATDWGEMFTIYIYIYICLSDKGLMLRIYKIGVKLNEILNSLVKNGQKI